MKHILKHVTTDILVKVRPVWFLNLKYSCVGV